MSVALIAGATGLVGNNLLHLLLASKEYSKVISIGRRKVKIEHTKLEQYIVDFNNLEEVNIKTDCVFCCLGTTIKKAGSQEAFKKVDFEYPKSLAKHSWEKGANSFHLISSMGANANSSIFYNKIKGEIEKEIINQSFKQAHIYRPSMLLGERKERRIIEAISLSLLKALRFLFVGLLKNYKVIKAERVAEFMLQSSLSKDDGVFVHSSGEMQ